jgi:uncharacterized protein YdeI (YjbR/CyaY-like superfamily)
MLDVRTRQQWRAWLMRRHASSSGVWLVLHKRHTGVQSIPREDIVREALCFGWIDSLVKRLDHERYAIKVTPRQPASKWSNVNRRRWEDLKAGGLLAPAGLSVQPTAAAYAPKPSIPELPDYIAAAISASRQAGRFCHQLPPRDRRNFVVWIHVAKRPETRERRLRESLGLLAAGKRLGLK